MQEVEPEALHHANGYVDVLDEEEQSTLHAATTNEPAAKPQTFAEVMRAMQRPLICVTPSGPIASQHAAPAPRSQRQRQGQPAAELMQVPTAGSRTHHEPRQNEQQRQRVQRASMPAPAPADSMPPDLPSASVAAASSPYTRVPNGVLARAQWAQANRDKLLREHMEKEARARTLHDRQVALGETVQERRQHMAGRYQAAVSDCKAGKTTESQQMRSHLATDIVKRRSTDMEYARQNADAAKIAAAGKIQAARQEVHRKTRHSREQTAVQQQLALDEKARRLAALREQTASKYAAKFGSVADDAWGDSAFAQYSPLASSTTRTMRRSHDAILQSPSPQLGSVSARTMRRSHDAVHSPSLHLGSVSEYTGSVSPHSASGSKHRRPLPDGLDSPSNSALILRSQRQRQRGSKDIMCSI